MKISCQSCGQILPKTALMCPNCGGRTFLPVDNMAQPSPQSFNHQPFNSQPVHHPSFSNPPPSPNFSQPPAYIPPVYVPPVAPPLQQPVYDPPAYSPQPASYTAQTTQNVSPTLPPTYLDGRKQASTMQYTGFWRRAFAYGFDLVLVGLLLGLAYQLLVPEIVRQLHINGINDQTLIISAVTFYLWYMAIFTSSGRQATIGKIIMGLWVFGMQGQRIGFFRALFREMLKVVLLPLFFVLWFTARKQTMADLMARTVVLYDPY